MFVKLDPGAFLPERAHPTDAGLDIRAMEDGIVRAKDAATFRTGVHVELPESTMGDIRPKSGLMFTHGILTFGTVDEGYDGEVMIRLFNLSNEDYHVHRGDKIAQLVVSWVMYEDVRQVDEIKGGERGASGFGSTGR